jgi:signal transduction histidine kinase
MILIVFIFSLPLAVFMYFLIFEINEGISNAKKGKQGAEYNQSIMKFFQDIQQHRGMSNAYLNGDSSFKEQIIEKQRRIAEDIIAIDAIDSRFGIALETTDEWDRLKSKWQDIKRQIFELKAQKSFDMHTNLVNDILALMVRVADISHLTLDDNIDGFYLMDTAVNKLPLAIEYAGQIRGFGAGAIVPQRLSEQEQAQLIVLSGLCRSAIEGVEANLKKAVQANPELTLLEEDVQNSLTAFNVSLEMLKTRVINTEYISLKPDEYFNAFTMAINTSFRLHDNVTAALNNVLQARTERLIRKRNYIVLFALLSLGIIGYVFMGNYFSVTNALSRLVNASRKIGKGDLNVNLSLETKDEISYVAHSFNEMAESLKKYTAELMSTNEALQKEVVERKRAEEKVKQAAVELERSNAELEHFAYVASHDLKEPLLSVAVDLKLIQRQLKGLENPDTEELISGAIDGANRMQTLISDLLAYSRAGSHGKPFTLTSCSDVLERVLLNLKVPLKECQANVSYDGLPEIMADSSQLVQLFQNLINNAIKFRGGETPRIHIAAKRNNNEWIFSVSDNGIGIPPDETGNIFQIFSRLHRDTHPGTGIGLATCKKIVEHHGGRIWVDSIPGKGSEFLFSIPAGAGPSLQDQEDE